MEKSDRRSEEETYLWVPFHFLDQTVKAILKCLGLLHQDSPATTKPALSIVSLNQPEKEDEEAEEEEEDVAMKEEIVVTSRGIKSGVAVTNRSTKVRATNRRKERVSSGRPGQHN